MADIVSGDTCHREIEATKLDCSELLFSDAKSIRGTADCLSPRVRGRPCSQRPEPRAVRPVRGSPGLRPVGAQVPVPDSGACNALYAQFRRCGGCHPGNVHKSVPSTSTFSL